jgi:hypothetical protein
MGLFDKLFGKKPEPEKVEAPKPAPKQKEKKVPELSAKEKATQAGEPYVNILSMEVDPKDINSGAFELDWNDKFVLNLIRAGFKIRDDDTDSQIVDRWFQTVCRNVALELYEQQQADPDNRYKADLRTVSTKDIGDGRTEVS